MNAVALVSNKQGTFFEELKPEITLERLKSFAFYIKCLCDEYRDFYQTGPDPDFFTIVEAALIKVYSESRDDNVVHSVIHQMLNNA